MLVPRRVGYFRCLYFCLVIGIMIDDGNHFFKKRAQVTCFMSFFLHPSGFANVSKSNCGVGGCYTDPKRSLHGFSKKQFLVMFHQEDLQIESYQSLVQQASFDLNAVVSRGSGHKRNCTKSCFHGVFTFCP